MDATRITRRRHDALPVVVVIALLAACTSSAHQTSTTEPSASPLLSVRVSYTGGVKRTHANTYRPPDASRVAPELVTDLLERGDPRLELIDVSPLLDITAPNVGVVDGIALRPGAVAAEKQWNAEMSLISSDSWSGTVTK